jgi:hypothetical protein
MYLTDPNAGDGAALVIGLVIIYWLIINNKFRKIFCQFLMLPFSKKVSWNDKFFLLYIFFILLFCFVTVFITFKYFFKLFK